MQPQYRIEVGGFPAESLALLPVSGTRLHAMRWTGSYGTDWGDNSSTFGFDHGITGAAVSARMEARQNAERSSGLRDVTKFPSTTTSASSCRSASPGAGRICSGVCCFQIVFLEFIAECIAADPKEAGGLGLIAPGRLKRSHKEQTRLLFK